ERGRGAPRARGQPLPLHRLPQHRQGRPRRGQTRRGARERGAAATAGRGAGGAGRAGGGGMSVTDKAPTVGGNGHVGRSLKRKEDPRLITGRATYVDDVVLPGMLHAAFVRSPEAHARITSIDTSAAVEHPSVRAVFTGEDIQLAAPLPMAWVPPGVEVRTPEHWPLARGAVKHVGDPVAVVISDDRYAAVDAAEQVVVDYDPLP